MTVADAASSTKLYFGPWYRKSPFFEATLRSGCDAYDIYNHMYLPGHYDDPVTEYWALVNDVTLWDVGVERVVEISGRDGFELTNMMTCRDLTRCAVGQGKYAPIIAPDGGIVNDPVLLRRDEQTFWLCLADSDVHLYAMGLAHGLGLEATVTLPEVYPLQVQGPKAKEVMRDLVGPEVLDVAYYWTLDTRINGIPVVISRTGWTGEIGYEVYLTDPALGNELWDTIMEAGRPHDIRPIAPCEARRIEAASSTATRTSRSRTTPSSSRGWPASSKSRRPTTWARLRSSESVRAVSPASLWEWSWPVTRSSWSCTRRGRCSLRTTWSDGSPTSCGRPVWSRTSATPGCRSSSPSLATSSRSSGRAGGGRRPPRPASPSSTRRRRHRPPERRRPGPCSVHPAGSESAG